MIFMKVYKWNISGTFVHTKVLCTLMNFSPPFTSWQEYIELQVTLYTYTNRVFPYDSPTPQTAKRRNLNVGQLYFITEIPTKKGFCEIRLSCKVSVVKRGKNLCLKTLFSLLETWHEPVHLIYNCIGI